MFNVAYNHFNNMITLYTYIFTQTKPQFLG